MITRKATAFEKALGHRFEQRELLERAFTHTSHAHEAASRAGNPDGVPHNEQLEFLGDAVLGLLVSEELFRRFPDFNEGQLSKLRAHVVSERYLIAIAKQLKLGAQLRLGHGEEKSGGRAKPTLLVDALEAVIAAVYLDGGLEDLRRFVVGCILEPELQRLQNESGSLPVSDFKSALQEAAHAEGRPSPDYALIKEEGPEHKKTFTVEVRLLQPDGGNGDKPEFMARAKGSTKKQAEQAAARQAVDYLRGRAPQNESPGEEPAHRIKRKTS